MRSLLLIGKARFKPRRYTWALLLDPCGCTIAAAHSAQELKLDPVHHMGITCWT